MQRPQNAVSAQATCLPASDCREWPPSVHRRFATRNRRFLDELKERQGLRNRGQVLEQLIENREDSHPAVITQKPRKPALPGWLSKLVTGLFRQ